MLPRAAASAASAQTAPAEAAAAGSSRSLADLLRLTRAVRHDRLDVFLFRPSTPTSRPRDADGDRPARHDRRVAAGADGAVPARARRRPAQARGRRAPRKTALHRLGGVSGGDRRALQDRGRAGAGRPEAPDPVFTPRSGEGLVAGIAEAGLADGDRYFLYAGGISPHKNVETLIDAYALARAEGPGEVPLLVLVGDLESETYLSSAASVRERIARHGLADVVRLPGFVSDEVLACLYSGATGVVIPSLAEGFGLPAVEAAACGAAVALSDLAAASRDAGRGRALLPADRRRGACDHPPLLERRRDAAERRRNPRARGGLRSHLGRGRPELRTLIHEAARLR